MLIDANILCNELLTKSLIRAKDNLELILFVEVILNIFTIQNILNKINYIKKNNWSLKVIDQTIKQFVVKLNNFGLSSQ